jgi:hypothetical protein
VARLFEIVEEIETNLEPLKLRGSNAKPEIEMAIALVVAGAVDRAALARALAIPRQAGKASEALNALRDSLRTAADETSLPPLFAEARQEINAIAPTLAYLETLSGPNERQHLVKWRCAHCAHGLMRQLSTHKPSSSPDSRFGAVASLIFEAVSGNAHADLKRACDSLMRYWSEP